MKDKAPHILDGIMSATPLAPRGHHRLRIAFGGLSALLLAAGLVGCSSGSGQDTSSSPTSSPSTPNTASFSGTPPPALASSASAAVRSAQASASAAASSASARASEFEASVNAETRRRSTAAQQALKNVEGRGNAISEVGMTGMPRAQTGGLLAVLVTITNKTSNTASYAVQIDFRDASGKTIETSYVGAENLAPGKKEQPIAVSKEPAETKLTPVLAKAQRY